MAAAQYRHHLASTNVRFVPTQETMLRRSESPQSALNDLMSTDTARWPSANAPQVSLGVLRCNVATRPHGFP
jgi:hypothetical protein